jgi:hypothetical protein
MVPVLVWLCGQSLGFMASETWKLNRHHTNRFHLPSHRATHADDTGNLLLPVGFQTPLTVTSSLLNSRIYIPAVARMIVAPPMELYCWRKSW